MTNLQKLCASGNCGISDDGIKNLNSIKLYSIENPKIKVYHKY
jgi:hypothetical protein